MNKMKAPKSLRFDAAINSVDDRSDNYSGTKVSAVASLIAVASFTGAEAQQTGLPPVTVDTPVAARPAAAKPTPDGSAPVRRCGPRGGQLAGCAVPFPTPRLMPTTHPREPGSALHCESGAGIR
jgi:catecholate siderophore receptor